MKKITLALAGNPNCGKTTLFNSLTGLRHHTGNWPGKTVSVDRDEGRFTHKNCIFDLVDLPGIYSLSSRTLEEELAADYLLHERPDVVVNIVDASHLEKKPLLNPSADGNWSACRCCAEHEQVCKERRHIR